MGKTLVIPNSDFSVDALGKVPVKIYDETVSVTNAMVSTDLHLLSATNTKWTLMFEGVLTQRTQAGNGFYFSARTADTNGAGLFCSVTAADGGKYSLNFYDPNGGSSTDFAINNAYDGLSHKIVVTRNGNVISLYFDNLASKKVATLYTTSDDELVFGKSWATSTSALQPFSNIKVTLYDEVIDESEMF